MIPGGLKGSYKEGVGMPGIEPELVVQALHTTICDPKNNRKEKKALRIIAFNDLVSVGRDN